MTIGETAKVLGVSITTLRRWEKEGRLQPDEITPGGHRRYDVAKLRPALYRLQRSDRKTVAYARVSSQGQKADLERQKQVLELYCASQGWTFKVISDLGSGNQGEDSSFEEDLAKDVLEIITVFSARLYGSRSRKNQKLIDGMKQVGVDLSKFGGTELYSRC